MSTDNEKRNPFRCLTENISWQRNIPPLWKKVNQVNFIFQLLYVHAVYDGKLNDGVAGWLAGEEKEMLLL